ncbi:hypothetical protein BT96DRAFT_920765 [Gymnopus androsaceus JB14]|uniref:NADH-ubiquinone oxidoreductase 21 kDa subunit n=1 Tax=Gymnopus androsaceus JB14 TaxID=1447944 RepID=A0A6A4HID8_9AGAR|nr:hypothetical protein BT96DRAFT_920765 [Gymnopus androsaceus JB14]
MPEKILHTPYPLIDIDPHFTRVVRYFRASDYLTWGVTTLAVPGAFYVWEMVDPDIVGVKRVNLAPGEKMPAGRLAVGNAMQVVAKRMATGVKVAAFLGFCGGFMLAYQNSSKRFWGWTENKREEEMDFAELSERAKQGLPLYGESPQSLWVQGAAHRNSAYSQLKFSAFPMFNFVNHPFHGVDTSKYYAGLDKSEEASS